MAATVQQCTRHGAAYVYVYGDDSINYGRPPGYFVAEVTEAAACRPPDEPPAPGPAC